MAYQSDRMYPPYLWASGIIRTGVVGAVMTLVVAGTRSLVPAMALHALIDIGAGTVTWMALKDASPRFDSTP